jgi:uncharacterized repeat protein (TIGR01451 family)
MKKMYLMLVLVFALCGRLYAQTASAVVSTLPCNNNGVVDVSFSGFSYPVTVNYYTQTGGSIVHTVASGTTDQLTNYNGSQTYITVSGSGNQYAFTSVYAPPFILNTPTVVQNNCPVPSTVFLSIAGAGSIASVVWYDVNNTQVATGNPASILGTGSFTALVTDNNGCVAAVDSFGLWANPPVVNSVQTPAACTNGSISITGVPQLTAPLAYLWSNGATTSSISSLMQGNYNVLITDVNGCTAFGDYFVPQTPAITVNPVATPATCSSSNGSAYAFPTGGTAPYSYVWSNGANTSTITNVPSGSYQCYVTDANNCVGTGYVYINSTSPVYANASTTLSSCTAPTGSIALTIGGGAAPYTTVWNTSPAQTGATATGLPKGNYSFNITDANGCTRQGAVQLNDVGSNIAPNFTITPYLCGVNNGAIVSAVSGGLAPYTYSWSTGATTTGIANLQPGTYNLNVTDAQGCIANLYAAIAYNSTLNLGLSSTPSTCIFSADGILAAIATGGASPYTYAWSNGGPNASTISGLTTGNYWLTVTDANNCSIAAYAYVSYNPAGNNCYCTITGIAYVDANSNCLFDAGEQVVPNVGIHNTVSGTDYTDGSGIYSMLVPTGNSSLSQLWNYSYPPATCMPTSIAVSANASSGCVITNNFATSVVPTTDMQTYLIDVNPPRPGFSHTKKIVTINNGTSLEPNAQSKFYNDPIAVAPTFANGYYAQVSGSSTYTNAASSLNMPVLSIVEDYVLYNIPANTPLGTTYLFGDTACAVAPITDWVNDFTPWNNLKITTSTVVGSYDPNFKEVSPAGEGNTGNILVSDSLLTYTVHFQNEGSYFAQNIYVLDTLDTDLDWTSLTPVYSSHPSEATISSTGVLKFNFENILLPTKASEPILSNGHFIYTIKVKKGLALGTQIKNTAAIYFDFNEPVITNTTVNTLSAPTSIAKPAPSIAELALFPNPSESIITADMVQLHKTGTLNIFNIGGSLVHTTQIDNQSKVSINTASLPTGQYFMKIQADGHYYRGVFSKR